MSLTMIFADFFVFITWKNLVLARRTYERTDACRQSSNESR